MKISMQSYANCIRNEQPKMIFDVISDLHIALPIEHKPLRRALNDIKQRTVHHVAILGDLTNNGYEFQYTSCFKLLQDYEFSYMLAMGNHDTYNMLHKNQLKIDHAYRNLGIREHHHLYYDEVFHGYHFYVLNSQKPQKSCAFIGQDQLAWLDQALTKNDKTKPSFILCHHPFLDTHLHSDEKEMAIGAQNEELKELLKRHSHCIYLSGHLHNSYEICRVLQEDSITLIDVPAFSNVDYGAKKASCGYEIACYHNFIHLRTRDYANEKWILSHEFIIDLMRQQVLPFDGGLLQDQ